MTTPRRPNVVLIMVDQLAAGWLPAYGHHAAQAPNITALANRGVTFESAYCASPLCAPSRSALLAGRRSSRVGVYDNAAELAASVPTVAHHLRAAGYDTCLSGKMHFVGPDQLHGFERRLTTDVYPAGLDWTPDWTRPVSDRLSWYHSMESVLTPARTTASMQTDFDDEVAFHAVRHVHDLARAGGERPFLLVVSFTNPHDPWEIAPRYWDRYDPARLPMPTVPEIPLADADPHSRRLREMCGADTLTLDAAQILRARHGYHAAISYVDERIGEVLSALGDTGLDEDTLIALTADHGEFLGERGLWYKMSFLDPSARVPLIVVPPGDGRSRMAGARVSTPVSGLDLTATMIELARGPEATAVADLDGHSLSGLLGADGTEADRPPVVCEYYAEGVTAPAAMIRSGAHKLLVCAGDPDLLYDLDADPLELTNLAAHPRYAGTVGELRRRLAQELDLEAIDRRVLASQRERRLVAGALGRGAVTPWDFQPHVDAAMQYVRNRADLYELQARARLESRAG
ncbi:MAG: choline-sulfatase [Actinomycetota bacterium]|nr:choline-sulfatase [Actinomycetota bacterium]